MSFSVLGQMQLLCQGHTSLHESEKLHGQTASKNDCCSEQNLRLGSFMVRNDEATAVLVKL